MALSKKNARSIRSGVMTAQMDVIDVVIHHVSTTFYHGKYDIGKNQLAHDAYMRTMRKAQARFVAGWNQWDIARGYRK